MSGQSRQPGEWTMVGNKGKKSNRGKYDKKAKKKKNREKQQNEAMIALVVPEVKEVEEVHEAHVAPEVCKVKEEPKTLRDCIMTVVAYYITVLNLHERPLYYGRLVRYVWYYLPEGSNVYQQLSLTERDSLKVLNHNYCELCGYDVIIQYFETYLEKFFIFLNNWVSFGKKPEFRCKPRPNVLVRTQAGLLYPQITSMSKDSENEWIFRINEQQHCIPVQQTSKNTVYADYNPEETKLYNDINVLKCLRKQNILNTKLYDCLKTPFSINEFEYNAMLSKYTKIQANSLHHSDLKIYLLLVLPRILPEIIQIILACCPYIQLHKTTRQINQGAYLLRETRYVMKIGD
jgi:hypothetical protein